MGQKVEFIAKKSRMILEKFDIEKFLDNNKNSVTKKLQPVYSAIEKTRKELDKRNL